RDTLASGAGGVGRSHLVAISTLLGPIVALGRAAGAARKMLRTPTPRLRLDLPTPFGDPSRRALQIVSNGDRWRVAFTRRRVNQGRSPARHWRVRFVTPDADTMMYLNRGTDVRTVTDNFVGPGWQHEVQAAGSSDTVSRKISVPILGRRTLNFRGKLDSISVKCWLNLVSRCRPRFTFTRLGSKLPAPQRRLPSTSRLTRLGIGPRDPSRAVLLAGTRE